MINGGNRSQRDLGVSCWYTGSFPTFFLHTAAAEIAAVESPGDRGQVTCEVVRVFRCIPKFWSFGFKGEKVCFALVGRKQLA